MLDFTVSSDCDIPGRARDSVEDRDSDYPPPIFSERLAETIA